MPFSHDAVLLIAFGGPHVPDRIARRIARQVLVTTGNGGGAASGAGTGGGEAADNSYVNKTTPHVKQHTISS